LDLILENGSREQKALQFICFLELQFVSDLGFASFEDPSPELAAVWEPTRPATRSHLAIAQFTLSSYEHANSASEAEK
jgi:hypothetical protein